MLFSAYRRDDFADPEGFVTQLGVILSDFPEEVVVYVTSPRTGLQRRSKWPPTISEVLQACEEHQAYLTKLRKHRPIVMQISAPRLNELPHGALANIFVGEEHHRYAALVEWSKTAEPAWWIFGTSSDGRKGILIPLSVWESPPPKPKAA